MKPRLTRDDDRWITEADPKYRHLLVAALVLEVEKTEGSRDGARECVYEAFVLLRKRLGFPGPLRILSDAMALLRCRADVQASVERQTGNPGIASAWWHLVCAERRPIEAGSWNAFDKPRAVQAAAALVAEARVHPGESLSRKLASAVEKAFLVTRPPDRPGPQSAAAARRR